MYRSMEMDNAIHTAQCLYSVTWPHLMQLGLDDGRVLKTIQKIFFQNLAIAYEQDLPVFSRDSL